LVALDARLTRQMSAGMRAYARELRGRLPRAAPDLRFVAFDRGENFGLDEQVRLPLALRRVKPRLVHHLSLYAPLAAHRPYVVTVHDLIHLRFPEYFKAKVRPYYELVVRRLCARAACVITDDERTVGDIERFLGVPRSRARVVALGVNDAFLGEAGPHAGPRPYFLYAGNHRPHKDLATLLAAWASLPEGTGADLYVTGPDDCEEFRAVRRRDAELRVLGEVGDAELARYYRGAQALVHPALAEGFGLPMLEAMALGTAVVACADAAPRILESRLRTFAARDAAGLRAELLEALRPDPAREARLREAREFARTLSWDRCAAETAAVYRELLEARDDW
jgi:glycosyltransferase involved in cell wall biosynthesis